MADANQHGDRDHLAAFEFRAATRLVVGPGTLMRLGHLGRGLSATRALVVSDPGVVQAGHAAKAIGSLQASGILTTLFSDFTENPTTEQVDAGTIVAHAFQPDLIIGIGGGSSMDCAKGINVLFSCGGRMHDYHGQGKATGPLLPSIAIPTTAGTGSETQSYALITDALSGEKMACGDERAAFRIALLDVDLTLTQPDRVTALTGIDAVAHAVESYVSLAATPASRIFSRQAWRLLSRHFPRVLVCGDDFIARSAVQLGAAWAGLAIENAMLGAAHSLANPLTANHSIVHGQAVGLMLPHVVRFNAFDCADRYAELLDDLPEIRAIEQPGEQLAAWLDDLLEKAGLAQNLASLGIAELAVDQLASRAAAQWTARFNPRAVNAQTLATLYRAAQ